MQVNPLAELSVLCVDADYMSTLHERWMGEKGPTDVLAFPMDELDTARPDDPEPGPALLSRGGEVAPPRPDARGRARALPGDLVPSPSVAAGRPPPPGHSMDDEL